MKKTAFHLIHEAESKGVTLVRVGERLKIDRGRHLPLPLRQQIIDHKIEIIRLLQRDEEARKAGFLPLHCGEVYERQLGQTMHVFIMFEGDSWSAWRESWRPGKIQSSSYKIIIKQASFELALLKAKHYIQFITRSKSGSP